MDIRTERARRRLTQADLAALLGCRQSKISKLETGRTVMNLLHEIELQQAFAEFDWNREHGGGGMKQDLEPHVGVLTIIADRQDRLAVLRAEDFLRLLSRVK